MLARVLSNAALTGGVLLGAVVVLAMPGVAVTGVMFGVVAGAVAGTWIRDNVAGEGAATARAGCRGGLLVGAGVFGGWLAFTGLILLLGPASGAVLTVLAVVTFVDWSGSRADRRIVLRRKPWSSVRVRLLHAAQQPDQFESDQPRPAPEGSEAPEGPGAPDQVVGPMPIPADLSTVQLCSTWQRTYFVLVDLPAGVQRTAIAQQRRGLLDEIERRDPDGFARWLDTGARAGSDPGRYLAGDR